MFLKFGVLNSCMVIFWDVMVCYTFSCYVGSWMQICCVFLCNLNVTEMGKKREECFWCVWWWLEGKKVGVVICYYFFNLQSEREENKILVAQLEGSHNSVIHPAQLHKWPYHGFFCLFQQKWDDLEFFALINIFF